MFKTLFERVIVWSEPIRDTEIHQARTNFNPFALLPGNSYVYNDWSRTLSVDLGLNLPVRLGFLAQIHG